MNRNKTGAVADMRTPQGLALVHSLVAASDVLVTNCDPPRSCIHPALTL